MASQPAPAHLDTVQLLRGLAAMSVVLFHVHWIGIGSFGVDIFFVLSGFIITHAASRDPRGFLAKRLARIVPLYWAATVAVFVAALVLPGLFEATEPTAANLARSLLFIPFARADGAVQPLLFLGWTLNCEMLFYAIFAAALTINPRSAPAIAVAVLMTLVLIGIAFRPEQPALALWTGGQSVAFALGIAVHALWIRAGQPVVRWPWLALAVLVLLALVAGPPLRFPRDMPVRGLLAAVLLLAALRGGEAVRWPAFALLIGDASYSLYLLHPYVIEGVNRVVRPLDRTPAGIGWTVAAVAVAVAVAMASFRLVERPANQALRRRLTERTRVHAAVGSVG